MAGTLAPWVDRVDEQVLHWIDARLSEAGTQRTAEPAEPRVRSWASVLSIPTDSGPVWFKSAAASIAYEVRVYPLLARTGGEIILHPIATDPERAWMLLPDGGTSLRHSATGDDLVRHWLRLVPQYAQLQRKLMRKTDALLQLGVPDMRSAVMPQRFDEAMEISRRIVERHGYGTDRAMLTRIGLYGDRYREWCEELAVSSVPSSLDHGELQANNILLALTYDKHDGTKTRRLVEPHRVGNWSRKWYLVGWDAERVDWRTFRIEEPPELIDHMQTLSERYARTVEASEGIRC